MKKLYTTFCFTAMLAICVTNAQQRIAQSSVISNFTSTVKSQPSNQPMTTVVDTLTNHWHLLNPAVDTALTYHACSASSFVAGNNCYGDKAKVQKFDSAYGVTTSNGTINALLLWYGGKVQSAGTATYSATVWNDNAGVPGTVLGSVPITISNIDTSLAAKHAIGPMSALKGVYNVVATFSTAIAIPSNKKFWAGITFTYAAGDSAGLVTSYDYKAGDAGGLTGDCKEAKNYTFEQWSDNTWHSFNDGTTSSWGLDIAIAAYPVVSLNQSAVNEVSNTISELKNYPNPANGSTTISYTLAQSSEVSLNIYDITGKKLMELNQGKQNSGNHIINMNVSSLSEGMYFYSLQTNDSKMTKMMSVVK